MKKHTVLKYVVPLVTLIAGIWIGTRFSGGEKVSDSPSSGETTENKAAQPVVYTCSMHPQIKSTEPGSCPICGMDLVPMEELNDSPLILQLGEEAAKIAGVRTATVAYGNARKEIALQGVVMEDERRVQTVTSRFAGRIEKLFVDFTGAQISKGQKLAEVYSPALINAQRELLEAMNYQEDQPGLYKAARQKLRLWNLSESQIDEIEKGGEPILSMPILSPATGIVTDKKVNPGDYISEGMPLFQVTDLSSVWVMFDAYEQDLPWIRTGAEIKFSVSGIPSREFSGKITFIDPAVDPATRTVRVRTETRNPGLALKPQMFARGNLESQPSGKSDQLMVPKSAVLWTGTRSVVYIQLEDQEMPTFQYREVALGPELGNHYLIKSGLEAGETVVSAGAFRVDAAAQLAGKYSMMNPPSEVSYSERPFSPKAFREQLNGLFDAYSAFKNELVNSDEESARRKVKVFDQKLQNIQTTSLDTRGKEIWLNLEEELSAQLDRINKAEDLEEIRKHFKPFSVVFVNVVEVFGLNEMTVYKDYCPMVDNDQGGIWLSEFKEIRNPYFGEKMMKCGEIKKVLNPRTSGNSGGGVYPSPVP